MLLLVLVVSLPLQLATKAASFAREMKSIKSELCFMQERCALLEEENNKLRDGFGKEGMRNEEDDLVIFQLISSPIVFVWILPDT